MAASFKIDEVVKLVSVLPQGPVKQLSVNQDGDIQYLVEYVDVDGVTQVRWFREDELTKV